MTPGVRAPRAGADAGTVDSAVPRRLVPAGGAPDRLKSTWTSRLSASGHRARCPSAVPARARCPVSSGPAAERLPARLGARRAARRAVGERRARPRTRLPRQRRAARRRRPARARVHDARRRRGLSGSRDRSFPPPTGCSARRSIWSACNPTATTSGRGCGRRAGRSTSFRCGAISWPRRNGSPARRTTRSCASRATACTRFRSGRCTRASSSPDISASRSSARRCCGSRSGWATCTRASKSASRR